MLKTYIGPFDEVEVVVASTVLGVVKHGESVAVPDELAAQVEWPEANWSDGPASDEMEADK